jgi:2-amino-4-hydroxy-6-hydroxymethyldihydropteridine diphosphokinase
MCLDWNNEPTSELAVIGLGSNEGDSINILKEAILKILKISDGFILWSPLYRSTPVDCPPGSRDFVNAVVAIVVKKKETPLTLLRKLQRLEKEFGRRPKKVINESRPLDLDIISFGRRQFETPELTLPHPRAHQRRFVLEPLAHFLPTFILPGQKKNVSELLKKLKSSEKLVELPYS